MTSPLAAGNSLLGEGALLLGLSGGGQDDHSPPTDRRGLDSGPCAQSTPSPTYAFHASAGSLQANAAAKGWAPSRKQWLMAPQPGKGPGHNRPGLGTHHPPKNYPGARGPTSSYTQGREAWQTGWLSGWPPLRVSKVRMEPFPRHQAAALVTGQGLVAAVWVQRRRLSAPVNEALWAFLGHSEGGPCGHSETPAGREGEAAGHGAGGCGRRQEQTEGAQ